MNPLHAEMLASLRQAHSLYLDSLGHNIATLERLAQTAGIKDSRLDDEIRLLRELRAIAEAKCLDMQASYAGLV